MASKRALGGLVAMATIAVSLFADQTHLAGVAATETKPEPGNSVSVDLGLLAETLDAINAELVLSGRIKTPASIRVALRRQPKNPRILDMVYRVPGIIQIYREAYVQNDGTVLLADSLEFANWERRASTHPISDGEFDAEYLAYDVRIESSVQGNLSATSKDRQVVRAKRKLKALSAP